MSSSKPNGEGEVIAAVEAAVADDCQRQLAALIAIIGRDNDHDTCPWCYFTPGWGHGKGCIRAACADIIPVRARTRRSDR